MSEMWMDVEPFLPLNPDYRQQVRDSFDRQPAMQLIGAQLEEVAPGRCAVRLPYRPDLTQQHGFFHGGLVGTIADSAGGYAAYSLMPAGSEVVTVEFKLNMLAPAKGEMLEAVGKVLRPGRTLTIVRVDVYAMQGAARELCGAAQQTLMQVRPDHGASNPR
jgi:uncharacterized protein (TIGR00369 family)